MKNSFLLLIFIFLSNLLIGQIDSIEISFQQSLDSTYVLKNRIQVIPLKKLHEIQITSVSIGLEEQNSFATTIQKYTAIPHINISNSDNINELLPSFNSVSQSDKLLLIGVNTEQELTPEILSFLSFIIKQNKVILSVWGDSKIFETLDQSIIDNTQAIIWNPINNGDTQSIAAQIIFGGLGVSNKLSQAIPKFQKGNGLNLKGGVRLAYTPAEFASINYDYLESSIDVIAAEALTAKAFPGMQVLVAKNSKVIFHKSYGYHTYEKERKVNNDNIYDLASVSKISTALPIIMKLHGENKFDLNATLGYYFPYMKGSNKANLTFREMLAHHSRLKPWIPYWKSTIKKNGKFKARTFKPKYSKRYPIKITDQLFLYKKYKQQKIYRAIKDSPLNETTGYKYSGLLFYLLPEMISNLVEEDYESYLNRNFYRRLGASTLTYNPLNHFPKERIIPTELDTFFRNIQIHGTVHDEGAILMGGVSANAGLFGSANDLAKLAQLYLNEGMYGGERYIKSSSINEFTKCQYCEEDNRRGLGFDKPLQTYHPQNSHTAEAASSDSYGHSGYTGTFVWIDPATDLIYIFFSNRVYPTRENRKIYELNIRPRIQEAIYNSFK